MDPDGKEIAVIIAIDKIAKRYGKLPSEIMAQATAFDFKCMDITESYIAYLKETQKTGRPPPPKLSVKQMQEMLNKTKGVK